MSLTTSLKIMAGSVGGAMATGLIWALWEALQMSGADLLVTQALAASSGAAMVVAALVAPLGFMAGLVWHHPRLGGAFREYVKGGWPGTGASLLAAMLGLMALGYGVFGLMQLLTSVFSATHVWAVGMAGSVPLLVLVLVAAALLVKLGLSKILGVLNPSQRVVQGLCLSLVLLIGLWFAGLAVLSPRFFSEVQFADYVAILLSMLGALAGGVALVGRRRLIAIAAPAVVVLGLGLGHHVMAEPAGLHVAIEHHAPGTRLVRHALQGTTGSSTVAHSRSATTAGQSATCFPGVDAPAIGSIAPAREGAPDILFITVDALRWDRTTFAKYKRDTTPNLFEHGKKAAVFEKASTPATSTRQTFRALFTGIYPSLVEAPPSTTWGVSFSPEQHTLASVLQEAGYSTTALVSDPGAFPEQFGALQGFGTIDDSPTPVHKEWRYSASYKVDRIISHMSDLETQGPRFIWTHISEAHQPYLMGPNPIKYGGGRSNRYDSALNFIDGELDRLLRFALGPARRDNTIVILTADHGHAFGEHGNRFHGGTVYQEESHVPLLVWGPSIKAGHHKTPISLVDLKPTVLDLVGLEVWEAFCGESLLGTLRDGASVNERPVYIEVLPDKAKSFFKVAFIKGPHKLILDPTARTLELYDLDKDPRESRNLAESKPKVVSGLLKELRLFYEARGMDPSMYHLDEFD